MSDKKGKPTAAEAAQILAAKRIELTRKLAAFTTKKQR